MAKNIRSKYIKDLLGESKELSLGLEASTKEVLKDILRETVNEQFRSILAESDDDFEEEEVNPDVENVPTETPEVPEENVDAFDTNADEEEAVTEPEKNAEEEEIWANLEQYKNNDGEYDLTGMSGADAARVLKVMDPDKDGIRIVRDGNKVELTDDNAGTEYVIELEPEEDVFDIDIEEPVEECDLRVESENHGNTGYTDDYQNKTAMTTPDMHEPSPMKGYRDWDKGAPKGTKKPWAGKGNSQPFNEQKENVFEVELNDGVCEKAESMAGGARTMKDLHNKPTNQPRHRRRRLGPNSPTTNISDGDTNVEESIKRKANEVFLENRELKNIAGKIKNKLEESYLLNYNLGRIVKLITENSTTRDEKINIVNRFSDSKSIEESNRLYESISKELQASKKTDNIEQSLNSGTLTEARMSEYKPTVVETSMYRSSDLHETLDLMERMDRLDNKK